MHREEAAYGRLLTALDECVIVPDGDVRGVVRTLAEVIDQGNEYSRVVFEHDAFHGLLSVLEPEGPNQEELGLRAALHRTEVSQLERAKRVARIDTVAKLAGALGVPISRLLDGIARSPGEYTPGSFRLRPSDETRQ